MTTEQLFRLPDLGEGLTEAEVLGWKVAVGDTVHVDQVVIEVETAKAAVEVPVPFEGTVLKLFAEAGSVVSVGEPLIAVGAAAQAAESGSGNVLIGYGTKDEPRTRRRRAKAAVATAAAPAAPAVEQAPKVISPLVRKLARDNGIDIATITPTGPDAIVLRKDVEAAIAKPAPAVDGERIPLRGMRRAIADKLSRSRSEIPDATTWVDVDATGLMEARKVIGVGVLALMARIVVAGLARYPELNSTVDTERQEIVRFKAVNLGFAAQSDRGLVVPVVRNANRLTTLELAAELTRLTELARAGTLTPEDMTGGTFTLNNYGVFGVDGSTPIINHPEAGLLGVGRIVDKPWAVDGQLAVRKVTQLSFTFDHRVCDGGVAGGFLRYVADCVERPVTMLGGL
ncbi:dihydrolipoamide acetyltransferase family protein [Kutzneria buriramensis]|uniref:Dihydrolipoamide acetyltransferase component of pyruvate dehydrogenase complex n=1 Tax=Kutzneria buriramensis TaxID=1045776 RepID=A0A3E0GYK4_9PSEU|nr:dihydrolipoamide acetyltransferase family protein [Kutzneria buriramensis]REH35190.1 pyruvate dehydrogenase E2 component (dihydrolipoamide acetyltransferase) [Kutzneria buriramensis]